MGDRDMQTLLSSFSIFKNIPGDELKYVMPEHGAIGFKRHEQLFRENEPADCIFCLLDGKAKVTKKDAAHRDTLIRFARPGDVLGLHSIFADGLHHTTATAIEDARALRIERNALIQFGGNHPAFFENILDQLSHEMREKECRITHIRLRSAKGRLLETLGMMEHTYGTNDRQAINYNFDKEELAGLIHVKTSSLSRILNDLQSRQLIRCTGNEIQILNLDPS
ncbi:Crp/Fnr family transcriptional regulator [bacterium]|nr:Crp/Fnr family transcriptional regulator [bacterium]